MSKGKSKKRNFKLISFKAFFDHDADILVWLKYQPPGERSNVLRSAIRFYMLYQQEQQEQLAEVREDTDWIRRALLDMPGYLEDLFAQFRVAPVAAQPTPVNNPSPAQPALDDSSLERRKARMRKARW